MISTKTLLHGVIALISLDILLTTLAVGYMGAIELNSFAAILGFPVFMVLKIVASVAAIYTICTYCLPSVPTFTRYGMMVSGAVYGAVCASNMYHVIGAVT